MNYCVIISHSNINICNYIWNTCHILPLFDMLRCSFQESMFLYGYRFSHFEKEDPICKAYPPFELTLHNISLALY